jgi:LPXTG-motif cell wall-anchored protein
VALQRRQLPFTGFDVPVIVIAGAAAITAGALLRRRTDGGTRRS